MNKGSLHDIEIIHDTDYGSIVMIKNKKYKGETREDWKIIQDYLSTYIGKYFEILENAEKIYIGKDFPDEFANSNSRIALKGKRKNAKANLSQAIPEVISIAESYENNWEENRESKHSKDAKNGWYRYTTRFALPVFNDNKNILRYNIYSAKMLVRHADDGRKYLYDFIQIKKKRAARLSKNYTVKTHFFIRYFTQMFTFVKAF